MDFVSFYPSSFVTRVMTGLLTVDLVVVATPYSSVLGGHPEGLCEGSHPTTASL